MRPFFSFYGAKYRAAPRYPSPGDTIVEPFAGAAGYSVRHNAKRVILIDLDPVIVGVWRYLVGASEEEILRLPDIAEGTTVDDYGLCPEARNFVGFWMNHGNAEPSRFPSKWLREGTYPNSSWGPAIRQRVASQLSEIRHWEVLHGDWSSAPDIEATWFIDPPYVEKGIHYRFGSSLIDFESLGRWCQEREGLVIVCENYGADWLPFHLLRTSSTNTRGRQMAEVVWTNLI